MKNIYLVLIGLLLCSTVTAGTYDKDIQLMASGVGVDSVVAIVEVNNTEIDSVLWKVFPVDSFITLPDTAILTIAWFWFFTDNNAEVTKYTTAYEQIPALNVDLTSVQGADVSLTYLALDTSTNTGIQGVAVSGYNMSDVRVAFGTTDGNGEITFGFKINDSIYFNSTNPINYIWVQRDTALLIQNGDLDTTEGYQFSGDAPAASSVAAVTIFVKDNAGVAIKNIRVTAQFVRGNMIDSTGIPISNAIQRGKTDSDGKFTFSCIWSSTVIPATDWRFTVHTLGGTVSRTITVGRQTTITLDFRQ